MTFFLICHNLIRLGYTFLSFAHPYGEIHDMTKNKHKQLFPIIILGLGLILIAVSGYYILDGASAQNDLLTVPVQVNFHAPELTLTDLNGETTSLTDYRGQVILVNLWATWCPPCKEEMPTLQSFHNKYEDDGFAVIAINDGDPTPDVVQFVMDYKLTFPVWLDPTYIATEEAFKTLNLPSSFVIDRNGTVRSSSPE